MIKISQLRRPIFLITAVVIAAVMLLTGCPETVNSPGSGTLDISLVLSGDAGGTPVLESASFSTATSSLTFNVSYLLEAIDIELDSEISGVAVSINGQALTVGTKVTITLSNGLNVIAVAVTPDSGSAVNYILNINRADPPVLSDNADLTGLELSTGYLTPAFTAAVVAYTSSLPFDTETITLTPTAADSAASITVNGIEVSSGSASTAITLEAGIAKAISVVVTAEDGDVDKTYMVAVTRREEEDTDPPVITLIGDDPLVVVYGSTFTDPGADVVDSEDGNWVVYSTDTVDTSTAGDYDLTYNAEDLSGNEAEAVTRTVTVLAKAPFELPDFYYYWDVSLGYMRQYMDGDDFYVVTNDDGPIDSGYYLEYDNDLNTALVYGATEGLHYKVAWTEPDGGICYYSYSEGHADESDARTASPDDVTLTCYTTTDIIPPVITLNDDASVSVEVGGDFTDPEATVRDWNIPDNYSITASDDDGFDIDTPDTYTFTYSVTDIDGNSAVDVTRTVEVTPSTSLELTDIYRRDIYGEGYIHIQLDDTTYTVTTQNSGNADSGTIEEYNNDANEVIVYSTPQVCYYRIEWTESVDGVFTETEFGPFASAVEAQTGSSGELSHIAYLMAEDVPPVLYLIGDETMFLDVGDEFNDEGATVVDWGEDDSITGASSLDSLNVTSALSGTYTLEYTSTDTDGNTAVPVTRTAIVGSGIADIIIQ